MACVSLTKGISKECNASMGGIKAVWLTNYAAGNFGEPSEGKIAFASATASNFYRFYTNKAASSMTSTMNIDEATGTNYITTEVALTFSRMDVEKRVAINTLRQAEIQAVLLDNNGKAWVCGIDNPVMLTAGTAQTGAAIGEANNYNITLTDTSLELPYELNAEDLDKLMAIV